MVNLSQSPPKTEAPLEWVRLQVFSQRTGTPYGTAAEWCLTGAFRERTGYRCEKRGSRWWVEMPAGAQMPQLDFDQLREAITESTQRALIDGYRLAADALERELETRGRFRRIELASLERKAAS